MRKNAQRSAVADRRAGEAVTLRIRDGLSYRQIGAQLGITPQAAHDAYRRGCAKHLPMEDVAEARRAALEKLDLWEQECLAILRKEHPLVSFGKVVPGQTDDMPRLGAMDRLLRIERERRAIVGYAAPNKRVVEIVTEDMLDRAFRELNEQIAAVESSTENRDGAA